MSIIIPGLNIQMIMDEGLIGFLAVLVFGFLVLWLFFRNTKD
jgi:hypothetical protein